MYNISATPNRIPSKMNWNDFACIENRCREVLAIKYASSANWRLRYVMARNILQEAGLKDSTLAVLSAILAIFMGASINQSARKYKIPEDKLDKLSKDPHMIEMAKQMANEKMKLNKFEGNWEEIEKQMMAQEKQEMEQNKLRQQEQEKIKKQVTKPSNINKGKKPIVQKHIPKSTNPSKIKIDTIIPYILNQELGQKNVGANGQTPVRITNEEMRGWATLYGYKIDKDNPKTPKTQNFIYLKNPEDVPKVVRKIFETYSREPAKWGWSTQPTLKQAIYKFDQTNPHGKIAYLVAKIPEIKNSLDRPLNDFL